MVDIGNPPWRKIIIDADDHLIFYGMDVDDVAPKPGESAYMSFSQTDPVRKPDAMHAMDEIVLRDTDWYPEDYPAGLHDELASIIDQEKAAVPTKPEPTSAKVDLRVAQGRKGSAFMLVGAAAPGKGQFVDNMRRAAIAKKAGKGGARSGG